VTSRSPCEPDRVARRTWNASHAAGSETPPRTADRPTVSMIRHEHATRGRTSKCPRERPTVSGIGERRSLRQRISSTSIGCVGRALHRPLCWRGVLGRDRSSPRVSPPSQHSGVRARNVRSCTCAGDRRLNAKPHRQLLDRRPRRARPASRPTAGAGHRGTVSVQRRGACVCR